jgi:hypothetical protein
MQIPARCPSGYRDVRGGQAVAYQSRMSSLVIGAVSVSCSYSISTRGPLPAFFFGAFFGRAAGPADDDGADRLATVGAEVG